MPTTKKITLRKCIVCGSQKEKDQFIRVVKNKENKIFIDETKKANGRGYYVCNSDDCKAQLLKTKALNRALRTEVDKEIYVKIENGGNG